MGFTAMVKVFPKRICLIPLGSFGIHASVFRGQKWHRNLVGAVFQ
jgi:hypothetical protein